MKNFKQYNFTVTNIGSDVLEIKNVLSMGDGFIDGGCDVTCFVIPESIRIITGSTKHIHLLFDHQDGNIFRYKANDGSSLIAFFNNQTFGLSLPDNGQPKTIMFSAMAPHDGRPHDTYVL